MQETLGETRLHRDHPGMHNGTGIGSLLRELTHDLSKLFRQEVELAKTEMREKIALTVRNVVYVAVGMCVALGGFLALIAGACIGVALALTAAGVDDELAAWLAPVGVGVILLIVGWACAQKGASTIANESLNPKNTRASLRATADWAQEKV